LPIFVFKGRMLPDQVAMTLDYRPTVAVRDAETIPDTEFALTVKNGAVRVEATTESSDRGIAHDLYLFAHDLARATAEVATIAEGVAYMALLDSVVFPDGHESGLVLADRRLAALMTIFPDHSFEEVFDLVAVDIALMRALSDTVVMLTWGHYAPIAAGRVSESILRMLAGGRSPADWEMMRSTLRVDRAYLQLLTDRAVAPRHGHRERVDAETNRQLAERAWTLMNRYLAYRLSGEKPLEPEAFPVLKG
jgi:hypothetical protein